MTDEEKMVVETLKSEMQTLVNNLKNDTANKSDFEALKQKVDAINLDLSSDKAFTELKDLVNSYGLEITGLKEGSNKIENAKGITAKQHADFVSDYEKNGKASMTIKSAAAFTTANIGGTHLTSYEVDSTIHEAPTKQPLLMTLLNKGMTAARTIFWANRKNKDGGSAFIAENTIKPLLDWDYTEESSTAKKISVRVNVSKETLKDFAQFQQEVNFLITNDLRLKLDSELLSQTESSTNIKGLIPSASSYTTTALDGTVVVPNRADAIRAAMLQMRLLEMMPNVVVLNPADYALLDLAKDANGRYLKIEIDGVLKQLQVYENTVITAGYFLLLDTSKWNVKTYEDLTIETGLSGEDFQNGMVTVIADMRLHSYSPDVYAGAVFYDDFATIIAALENV